MKCRSKWMSRSKHLVGDTHWMHARTEFFNITLDRTLRSTAESEQVVSTECNGAPEFRAGDADKENMKVYRNCCRKMFKVPWSTKMDCVELGYAPLKRWGSAGRPAIDDLWEVWILEVKRQLFSGKLEWGRTSNDLIRKFCQSDA